MKIILINHYAGSQNMGMEFRPYYLAAEWKLLGVDTTIIGGSYSHVRQKQPHVLGWENIDSINYLWLWTNRYKGNGIMRLISMIVFMFQLLVRSSWLAYKLKPNVVIASSTYPLDIFPSFIIARLSKAKLVFEIHDLWPLSPMELGGISKWHPFIIVMRFAEWFAYKMSDKIVSILPNTYSHVALDGVQPENFLHIPNGVVENITSKYNKANPVFSLIKDLNNKGHKIIVYTGSIGIANNLDTLIKAANKLEELPVTFLIIGNGPELSRLKNFSGANVMFVDAIPKSEIIHVLKVADFAYLGLKKQSLYRFGTSQNKLYDYMLAGKPIIQAMEVEGDIVKDAKCGFIAPAENPEILAEIVKIAINTSAEELRKMGSRAREYVIKYHNYKVLAKKFLNFIS